MSQQPSDQYPQPQSQYPQQPPAAINVPQRSGPWQRYKAIPRGAQIGIVAAVVIGACALCTCAGTGGLVALGSILPTVSPVAGQQVTPHSSTPTATSVPPTATSLPTTTATALATPTVTRTPAPLVTGATLGGTDSAFYAKYGYQSDNLFEVNGVVFSINLDNGADGKQRTFEMLVYKSDATTWTMAQAQQICGAFLPPDAKYQRKTTSGGNPETIYSSKELANSFAPSASFYDPSGTASITYVFENGGVFQCNMEDYA